MKSLKTLEEQRAALRRKLAQLAYQEKSGAAQPVTRAKLASQLTAVDKSIFRRRQIRLSL